VASCATRLDAFQGGIGPTRHVVGGIGPAIH